MLLATCVNTPIYCNVFHNLHAYVARCSASCVNGAQENKHTEFEGLLLRLMGRSNLKFWRFSITGTEVRYYGKHLPCRISAQSLCIKYQTVPWAKSELCVNGAFQAVFYQGGGCQDNTSGSQKICRVCSVFLWYRHNPDAKAQRPNAV